jgi:hypothetical protein
MSDCEYLVEFKFYLEPVDAENLCSILNSESCRMLEESSKVMVDDSLSEESKKNYLKWYKGHKVYLDSMLERIAGSSLAINMDGSPRNVGIDPKEAEKHRVFEPLDYKDD